MIEDLKPYPQYKDSGLPWLGQVPVHWEIARGRQLFEVRKRIAGTLGYPVLSITQQGLRVKDISRGEGQLSQDYSKYQLVKSGEFAMNAMDLITGGVGIAAHEGVTSPDYRVFAVRNEEQHNSRFYLLLFRMLYANLALYSCGQGSAQLGRWRLPRKRFNDFFFPTPPANEQAAIARFLAWATNRLDRAIGAKCRIIALLQEQKQAIIHRAVTRGLDPSVPLKDSGIPWLGEIPEHWEVRRLGHAVCLQTGYPFTSTGFIQAQSGTRLLRGVNVTPSQIRWDEVVRWQRHVDDSLDDYTLQVGDVVLGMDRPIIGAGVRTALIRKDDTPSLLLQRVARLRSTEILDTEFMLLLLRGRTFHEYMAPIFTGISVPHLSPQQIKNFRVALPPIEEQRNIVAELMEQTYELDNAIASNEKEITLLREYRTRLIADVVTGKLDVREVAAGLPEPHNANDEQLEPEEEEPEFEAEDVETESMD